MNSREKDLCPHFKVFEMQAFAMLKAEYPNVCLVHLYALEGAIHNTEYNNLSEDKKKELKEFSDFLGGRDK